MKLFCISYHIGVADLISIFQQLDHQLDVWSLSDHNFVMGWRKEKVDVVDWRNISQSMCDRFYERYKDELNQYDAFITYYPPAFAALFEKFEKPIIMYIPLRYETGLTLDWDRWNWFNEWIEKVAKTGQVKFVTNNLYDQEYFKYYTKQKATLISSLCDYTGAKYTGSNDKHLFSSKLTGFLNFVKMPNLIDKTALKGYSWQELADFRSITYLPYSNSNISIFESYTSGIPMLFPTFDLLKQMWISYWNRGVMSELSWFQIFGSGMTSGIHLQDPNNFKSLSAFKKWVPLSDFYDIERLPFLEYYESIGELEEKLYTLNFNDVSAKMLTYGERRKETIFASWEEILQ